MAEPSKSETGARPALWGFITGVACCLVALPLFRFLLLSESLPAEKEMLAVLSLLGGILFAIGRGLAGSVAGSVLGGVSGVFLGGAVSVMLPTWTIPYEITEQADDLGYEFHLKGPGLDGKTIDVADYRGKVLLVDFWATWCVPCLHELPNVIATYEKYHADGFDIVGVSLDETRQDLTNFLDRRSLPWKQVFIDEPGKMVWDNPLVKEHRVRAVPATFLLDREGRVAAVNLRGSELKKEVARLLKVRESDPATPGIRKRVVELPVTSYLSMLTFALLFGLGGALLQRSVTPVDAP